MKMLTIFFIGFLACLAEAHEQWRVERYADVDVKSVQICERPQAPKKFSWFPSITPGWPLRGGKWLIKWEGTF